ncbi:hypothetical protein [Novosphingobium album (ex Liu et al. 2023)]|uniref:DUF883 family protein n=1 Tax=Novosphingobium album (ex Liu et al. 2023) TaxID=3031130 RepID=A0ABT5WUP4_9SPHN|nr:hypothetical protein [Novosphingobium album (ex Liu et al. 2023)]MDE8653626.1 hypothetical protein [Novosphingobium album (ex Liu et al. 2023)]
MDETTASAEPGSEAAKNHFTKAMEEAKAGAQALGKEAQARAEEYREKLNEAKEGWSSEAKAKSGEAKEMAFSFANEGKARTSQALTGLGKMIEDNAGLIDEKVGPKYGEYARGAARSIHDAAGRLDEKSLDELGEDAREFVRQSPALAVGLAAAAGFLLARVFRGK